jgi:hypothetical protein
VDGRPLPFQRRLDERERAANEVVVELGEDAADSTAPTAIPASHRTTLCSRGATAASESSDAAISISRARPIGCAAWKPVCRDSTPLR